MPVLAKQGDTFDGWWTKQEGGTQIDEITHVPSTQTTYYAHWTSNTQGLMSVNPLRANTSSLLSVQRIQFQQ